MRDLLKRGLAESRELLRKKDETRDRESRLILIYFVYITKVPILFQQTNTRYFKTHGQVSVAPAHVESNLIWNFERLKIEKNEFKP